MNAARALNTFQSAFRFRNHGEGVPVRMPASASHVSSLSGAPAALPAATRLPHAPSFRRPLSSRCGEALWERVEAGSGSLGAASSVSRLPRCLFTGTRVNGSGHGH
jgi:hypothetical protein